MAEGRILWSVLVTAVTDLRRSLAGYSTVRFSCFMELVRWNLQTRRLRPEFGCGAKLGFTPSAFENIAVSLFQTAKQFQ